MKAESAETWELLLMENLSSKQKYAIALSETMLISAKWPQSIIWLLGCGSPRQHAFVLVFILQQGQILICVFSRAYLTLEQQVTMSKLQLHSMFSLLLMFIAAPVIQGQI